MTAPASTAPAGRATRRVVGARVALLFDQHASMVLGLCRLLLRDHHEAEDAAQQTFVSAYRSFLRGNEPRDAEPWLAAIARNECRARIRKRMRAPLTLDGELETQLADPVDITDIADRRSELAEITVAMADLPIRQREAVALRDFLGLSYEEVASTLSVSVPVVESLLFRARRRLRDTVRTVPRYAAGLAAVPLALRAAVAREVPDFDTAGSVVGGAAAALAAGLAKLISLPFAGKAATAVAVVVAGTVAAPLLGPPSRAPEAVIAAPATVDPSAGPAAPELSSPSAESSDPAPAPSSEPAQSDDSGGGGGGGAEAVTEDSAPAPPPPPAEGESAEPDRIEAGAGTGAPPQIEPPQTPPDGAEEPAPACEAGDGASGCADEVNAEDAVAADEAEQSDSGPRTAGQHRLHDTDEPEDADEPDRAEAPVTGNESPDGAEEPVTGNVSPDGGEDGDEAPVEPSS